MLGYFRIFDDLRCSTESLQLIVFAKFKWCPGAESNHRHEDFQSTALPLSYPGTGIGGCPIRSQSSNGGVGGCPEVNDKKSVGFSVCVGQSSVCLVYPFLAAHEAKPLLADQYLNGQKAPDVLKEALSFP